MNLYIVLPTFIHTHACLHSLDNPFPIPHTYCICTIIPVPSPKVFNLRTSNTSKASYSIWEADRNQFLVQSLRCVQKLEEVLFMTLGEPAPKQRT